LAFFGDLFFATTAGFAAGCGATTSGAGAGTGAATGSEVTSGAATFSGAAATGAGTADVVSCLVAQADRASIEKSKMIEMDDLRIPDMVFSRDTFGKKMTG
jgi:hypothetical protein